MLELQNVKKAFNGNEILKGISLNVEDGEIISILGPSGSGKTTLLNLILGITDIDSGKLIYNGEDLTKVPMERRGFNIVFQDYALFPNLNAYQNITYGLKNKPGISTKEEVDELIELLGLKEHLDKRIEELSGGQKQRVAIVRALCMHPEILLLDEITAALDPEMVREVLDVVLSLAKAGSTMVIVTHEMNFARAIADRILFIENGAVVEQSDDPKAFFASPETDRAKAFLKSFDYE